MHTTLGVEIWAAIAAASSDARIQIVSGWREIDQLRFPGQQYVEVGWVVGPDAGTAPRLFIYRADKDKSLQVRELGDWTYPEVTDSSDEELARVIDALTGIEKALLAVVG